MSIPNPSVLAGFLRAPRCRPRTKARSLLGRVAGLVSVALLATALGLVQAEPAGAGIFRSFAPRYQSNANGAIAIVGNTNSVCPAATACTNALASNTGGNNNSFAMILRDSDTDPVTTSNSSSADLTVPPGSVVKFAGLYWGAYQTAPAGGVNAAAGLTLIRFKTPGGAYVSKTATQFDQEPAGNFPYQSFVDVTADVVAAGSGTYWGGDIRAATGTNTYSGWSLVVVYENSGLPLRNLTVYDGFASVTTAAGNNNITIPISGFLTPPSGTVQATVGLVSYEGDGATVGDQLRFNGVAVSDAANPLNNSFNSSISQLGANVTTRSNPSPNTLGYDIDVLNGAGLLTNSQTATTINLTTAGDFYYPGVLTTQIDLYAPIFPPVTKTAVDVNGGNLEPGDIIDYTLSYSNIGQDAAVKSVLTDPIPANVTYLAGSLALVSGPQTNGPATDAAADDLAEFLPAPAPRGSVRFRVGAGANATTGGRLAPGAGVVVSFRVTVDAGTPSGTRISNQAQLSYVAETLNQAFTHDSNGADLSVLYTDVGVTKTASPSPVIAGTPLTYTLNVVQGHGASPGTVVSDPLPAAVTFNSATVSGGAGTCTFTAGAPTGTVTCTLGTLSGNATRTITVTVTPSQNLASGTVLSNTATITNDGTVRDLNLADNTSITTSPVTTSADLRLGKTTTPNPAVAGSNVTSTITVTNDGPSAAIANVTDPLPAGVSFVSATSTVGSCTEAGGVVSCTTPSLAAGATATITVVGTLDAAFSGVSLANTANVTSPTPDPNTANNVATATVAVLRSADVVLTKSATPASLVAGLPAAYTLVVTNNGPSNAQSVVLTDVLPAGVTYGSVSASVGSCSYVLPTHTLTCPLGTLPAGSSATVTLSIDVAAGQTASPIVNSATATSSTPDPAPANNIATSSNPLITTADVHVSKIATPDPATAGAPLTYTINVTNNGPSFAQALTVTDPIPVGLVFVSVTSTQGVCTFSGGTVSCSLGIVPAQADATITIVTNVPSGAAPGAVLNTATASSPTPDPDPTDNVAIHTTSVGVKADLSVDKTAALSPVLAGQAATWMLTVTNDGPSDASAATLSDVLPAGLSAVTATSTGGTCTVSGGTVGCAFGTLPAGASRVVTVTGTIDPATPAGPMANTATVASTTPDPTTSNNSSTVVITIAAQADLATTKTVMNSPVVAGSEIHWTLTVRNNGPSSAAATTLTDMLPSGLSFVSATPTSGSCSESSGLVSCALGAIGPGGTVTVELRATVPANMASGTTITNSALSSSPVIDPDPANNSATSTTTVTTSADVAIAKSAAPSSAAAGQAITWTIAVTNRGPSDALATTVTDVLPAGVTVTGITTTAGTCSGAVTCNLGQLPAGGTVTITVIGTVDTGFAAPTLVNTATVTSSTADPEPADNTSTSTTPVTTSADLVLAKTAALASAIAGTELTYTLSVTNLGPSVATGTMITDPLPAGTTLFSATPGCTLAAGVVTCPVGALGVGASATFTIRVHIASNATAPIANTATASSTTPDPVPANNISATTTPIAPPLADVRVLKTTTASPAVAGGPLRWVIQIINDGPSDAAAVTLTDALPGGVTLGAITTTGGTCSGAVTCVIPNLAAGEIVNVTIDVVLAAGHPVGLTALQNSASVTSTTADPDPSDNTTTAITPVEAIADISVTKTATPSPATAGSPITWTVQVSNAGPSNATGVVLSDTLPSGVVVTATTPACSQAGLVLSCPLGALSVGGSSSVTITATIAASQPAGSIANTAVVNAATFDPKRADNTATLTTPLVTSADVAIMKVATGSAVPGQPITYTITVRNYGPSTAQGVTVDDPLPPGLTLISANATGGGTCTGSLDCSLGSLAPGATITITVLANVAAAFTGSEILNTAAVSSTTVDPDPSNNTSASTTPTSALADLRVTKTATPDPVAAGSNVTYVLTATNLGPSDAQTVVVADTLPAGQTVVSAGSGCTTTATTAQCRVATLAVGASTTFTVVAAVAADQAGLSIGNTATISAATTDPTPANNTASVTIGLVTLTDLVVAKSVSPTALVPGTPATYTLTVRNAGPSDAQNVVLLDTVPAAMTVVASSAGCGLSGSTVTCTQTTLAAGATASFTFTVDVSPAATAATYANTVTASSTTAESDPADNTATIVTPTAPSADVSVTKTASSAQVTPGTPLSYRLIVRNVGPSDAQAVELIDPLPVGVTVTSLPAPCSQSGSVITCALGTLAAGAIRTFDVTTLLDPGYLGVSITNNVSVASSTPDPVAANNSVGVTTPSIPVADLVITKAASPLTVTAGTDLTYTLTLTNRGPSDAQAVVVSDTLPAGLTVVSVGAGCTAVGQIVTCTTPTLAAGVTVTYSITAAVSPGYVAPSITNTASASTTTPDPVPADNSSTLTTPVLFSADLLLAKTATPSPVTAGTNLTYTLMVTNRGPSNAQALALTDTLPAGLTIVTLGAGCTAAGQVVTCTQDSLGAGVAATFTMTALVSANYGSAAVANSATVSSTTPDPAPADNASSTSTPVATSANLSVGKSVLPGALVPGTAATYTLTVTNSGPSDAQAVVATDTLAAPLAVTGLTAGCVQAGQTVTCSQATLAAGATATFTITVLIDAAYTGPTVLNTVVVSSATPDPNPADNTTTITTPSAPSADVSITKSVLADPLVPGTAATYTLTVRNDGPSDAQAVVVTDTLAAPLGITAVGAGCTPAGQTVTCSRPTLAAGATVTYTISVLVAATYTGATIANTATVSSVTPDPDPSGNTTTITTPTAPSASLSINKSVTPSPVVPGTAATYTITVSNAGPSDAQAVTVTDTLAGPFTVTAWSGACSLAGRTITCSQATLAAGATATYTITLMVDPASTAPTIANTATVASITPDPNPTDDTTTIVTPSAPSADVSVSKSVNPDPLVPGAPASYTIIASNAGPSDAQSVVVSDTLPASLVVTGSSAGCSWVGQSVTCSRSTLAAGASATYTILVGVDPAYVDLTVANTASVESSTPDPDLADNTFTVSTPSAPSANLAVSKSVSPAPLVPGRPAVYTLVVTNAGPSDAQAVVVTDTLPVAVSVTALGAGCTQAGQTVTCTQATLAAGATATFTVTVLVDAAYFQTSATNAVTVSSSTADPDPSDNSTAIVTPTAPSANVSITKTVTPSPLVPGAAATYAITVVNAGPSDAQAVTVIDTLAAPLAPTALGAGCTQSGQTITCVRPTLAAGATAAFTITVLVDAAFTGPSVANTASVSSLTPDPNPADNTTTITTPSAPSAAVSIVKSVSPVPLVPGTPATYTLSVTNSGPSDAQAVIVADTLPAELAVSAVGAGCAAAGQTVTCTRSTLAAGATGTFTITALVNPAYVGLNVLNTATVGSATPDPNAADNTSTTTTFSAPLADLSIVKSVAPAPLVPGTPATYTITVTNAGPSDAQAVTVSDTLAAPLTVTALSAGCSQLVQVTCSQGTLAAGATVSYSITVLVSAAYTATTIDNTATVATTTPDPDPTNNTSTTSTPTAPSAALSLVKTVTPVPLVPGTGASYTLTVANSGPSDAQAVNVVDTLPAALSVSSVGAGCVTVGQTVTCTQATLAAGATVAYTIQVAIDSTFGGATVTNTARVSTTTPDPTPTDNTATTVTPAGPAANLRITKTADHDPVVAGTPVVYTLTVLNAGPSTAQNVVVTDVAPAALAVTAMDPRCIQAAQTVTCTAGTMAPGATTSFAVTARLDPAYTASTVANTASVATTTADQDPTDNSSTYTTTVRTVADLALTKTASPNPAVAGTDVTFVLTVANLGPSDAQGVVITDLFPAELTVLSVDPGCAVTGQSITCSAATLANSVSRSFSVVARVSAATLAPSATNSASVAAATVDPQPQNNAAAVTTPLITSAALSIRKTATPEPVISGSDLTYTIVVTNAGPSDAQAVTVSDTVAAGLTVLTSSSGCSVAAGTVTCAAGVVAAGTSVAFTIVARVAPSYSPGSVTNTATVTSSTPDSDPSDNASTVQSTTITRSDLQISKTPSASPVVPGEPVTYTIMVTNRGPSDAQSVTVTDTLMAGLTPLSASPGCTISGQTITCNTSTLPASATVISTITAAVATGYLAATVSNTATVNSTTTDPAPGDNTTTTVTPSVPRADLRIAKSTSPSPVVPGTPLTWTITVDNLGPSDAQSVVVSDVVPAGVTISAVSAGCSAVGQAVTCSAAALVFNTSITFTIDGFLDPEFAPPTLPNTVTVSSTTSDPFSGDNTATLDTPSTPIADLSVTKTAGPDPVIAGTNSTFVLTVHNDGPSSAHATTVTDILPAQLRAVSVSPACRVAGQIVQCVVASLPPGATTSFVVVAQVAADYLSGASSNTANAASVALDPRPSDNVAAASQAVITRADLSAAKSVDADPLIAGTDATFRLSVTNQGPSDAQAVTVSDPLPPGLTILSVPPGCTYAGTIVNCQIGTLAAGHDVTFPVVVHLASSLPNGLIHNTVSVESATVDPDSTNNAVTIRPRVERRVQLVVQKASPDTAVHVYGRVAYTLTVANNGPSDASGVALVDALPAGVAYRSSSASHGGYDADAGVWTIGDLPNGGRAELTIITSVTKVNAGGSLLNSTGPLSVNEIETDPSDNAAQLQSQVAPYADIQVTKVPDDWSPAYRTAVGFTITVRNDGPNQGTGIVVEDRMDGTLAILAHSTTKGTASLWPLRWLVGTLEPGEEATWRIVTVGSSTGTLGNVAQVMHVDQDDFDNDNDVSVGSVHVSRTADLRIAKSVSSHAKTNVDLPYTITLTNGGPDTATGVVVRDLLPAGLVFVRAEPSVGVYNQATSTWTVGSVAVGETATLVLVVYPTALGSITNRAVVDADTAFLNRATAVAGATVSVDANGPPRIFGRTGSNLGPFLWLAGGLILIGLLFSSVASFLTMWFRRRLSARLWRRPGRHGASSPS